MIKPTTTKVKATKRGFRIWIEGAKLAKSGFNWGTRYTRAIDNGVITMRVDPDGELKTSGRERNGNEVPIIDISLSSLAGFKGGQVLSVSFTNNRIIIK